jgi:hypothetical protein
MVGTSIGMSSGKKPPDQLPLPITPIFYSNVDNHEILDVAFFILDSGLLIEGSPGASQTSLH